MIRGPTHRDRTYSTCDAPALTIRENGERIGEANKETATLNQESREEKEEKQGGAKENAGNGHSFMPLVSCLINNERKTGIF